MDPTRRVTATLNSDSSLNSLEEISQEVASTSQLSFSEEKTLSLINFKASPDSNYLMSLPEGLLQQQCRDEMTQQEGQGERSAFPHRKTAYVENMRQKTLTHMTPYQVQRKGKISSSYNRYQKKCQCHYCQTQKEDISGNPERQNPPSWKALVEGFTHLNLNPDTIQACCLPNELPQVSEREKSHQEKEKKSKRIPQRNLK